MSKIFLLSEEPSQEDFTTEARYLYRSKFNLRAFHYLDQKGYKYLYLSYTHGILDPCSVIVPYVYKKKLSKDGKRVWSIVTHTMLSDYLSEGTKLFLFYSGYRYKVLEDVLSKEGITIISPIRNYTAKMRLTWLEHIISEDLLYRLS